VINNQVLTWDGKLEQNPTSINKKNTKNTGNNNKCRERHSGDYIRKGLADTDNRRGQTSRLWTQRRERTGSIQPGSCPAMIPRDAPIGRVHNEAAGEGAWASWPTDSQGKLDQGNRLRRRIQAHGPTGPKAVRE
jgi:hypothetical protein